MISYIKGENYKYKMINITHQKTSKSYITEETRTYLRQI